MRCAYQPGLRVYHARNRICRSLLHRIATENQTMTVNDPAVPEPITGAALGEQVAAIRAQIGQAFIGQAEVLDQLLVALLAAGHVLLEGVPGLGKTLLVRALAAALDCQFARVQFTPDLMPSDVSGHAFYDPKSESFKIRRGPVFTNLLLADEINRAPAKTQAALLEVMQEQQVTIESRSFELPPPFLTVATQNPIEQEGTYPLPEAQLDRFLMQVDVDYPDEASERQVILATTTNRESGIKPVFTENELLEIQALVRDTPVGESVVDAILKIVRRGRPGPDASKLINDYVTWAPGPRASQALMLACRAKALLEGRPAPSVDDVLDLAEPILKHRMAINYQARADGITLKDIIRDMTKDV